MNVVTLRNKPSNYSTVASAFQIHMCCHCLHRPLSWVLASLGSVSLQLSLPLPSAWQFWSAATRLVACG
eukprot:2828476-Prymnesium_polylepis.1